MKKLEIQKNTVVGKLIEAVEYKDFEKQIKAVDNIADTLVKIDETIEARVEEGKEIKRDVDTTLRPYKTAMQTIRANTALYMQKNNIEKIEGVKSKSITFQAEKKVITSVAKKQMMVGRKYTDLSEISYDKLVEMLEDKGVKTRVVAEDVTTTTAQNIRVTK